MTNPTDAITIRPATALDAVNIAKLIRRTLGPDRALRVNDTKVVQYVVSTIEKSFVAVAEHVTGRILGSFAMTPAQQPWSDDWFMSEAWFCVLPSAHHTADTGRLLLADAMAFADSKNMPMCFISDPGDESKLKLVTHVGAKPMRAVHLRMPAKGTDAKPAESRLQAAG